MLSVCACSLLFTRPANYRWVRITDYRLPYCSLLLAIDYHQPLIADYGLLVCDYLLHGGNSPVGTLVVVVVVVVGYS